MSQLKQLLVCKSGVREVGWAAVSRISDPVLSYLTWFYLVWRKSLEFRKGSTSGGTSSRCRQSEEGDADIGAVHIPCCTQSEFLSTEDLISDQDKPVNGETTMLSTPTCFKHQLFFSLGNCFSLHTKHNRSSHFRLFLRQSGLEEIWRWISQPTSLPKRFLFWPKRFFPKEVFWPKRWVFIVQPFLRAAVFTLVDGDTLGRPFSQFHVYVDQRDARWQPGGRTKLLLPADGRETHCYYHHAQYFLAQLYRCVQLL